MRPPGIGSVVSGLHRTSPRAVPGMAFSYGQAKPGKDWRSVVQSVQRDATELIPGVPRHPGPCGDSIRWTGSNARWRAWSRVICQSGPLASKVDARLFAPPLCISCFGLHSFGAALLLDAGCATFRSTPQTRPKVYAHRGGAALREDLLAAEVQGARAGRLSPGLGRERPGRALGRGAPTNPEPTLLDAQTRLASCLSLQGSRAAFRGDVPVAVAHVPGIATADFLSHLR